MMKKRHIHYKRLAISFMATSVLLSHQSQVKAEELKISPEELASTQVAPIIEEELIVSDNISENEENQIVTPQSPTNIVKEDGIESITTDKEPSLLNEENKEVASEELTRTGIKSQIELQDTSHVQAIWEKAGQGEGSVVAVIDGDIDTAHEMLSLTDVSKAHYKDSTSLDKIKAVHDISYGKWISPKIPFFHDYTLEGNQNFQDEGHGTHVSGILVGNSKQSEKSSSPYLLKGILPEAQLLFLKVATPSGKKEFPISYANAIRDAVNLGAQTINISLGKASESLSDLPQVTLDAIAYAKEKGVSIITSTGNNRAFGGEKRRPLATNPDFGVVGSPAVVDSVLAVASYRPASRLYDAVTAHTKTQGNKELAILITTAFESEKSYDYQFAGFGKENDFVGIEGKIALVERGELDFAEKIKNAKKAGALGIIIVNNESDDTLLSLPKDGNFAIAFMSKEDGEWLKKHSDIKLQFNGKVMSVYDKKGNQISEFSSWGVTADGSLKPDISAPGEDIYSSLKQNTYGTLTGTSMAAPQVAGIIALLQKLYTEKYPDLSDSERLDLVKKIVMSSATTLYNSDAQAYYSPRQQGAGAIDAEKASKAELFLTDELGNPTINLKQVDDQFTVTVVIHNIGNQTKTLEYQANLLTDQVDGHYFALKPRSLYNTEWRRIMVNPNSKLTVELQLDSSAFAEELQAQMPNGYFLDGFVRFREPQNQLEVMSIPFVGFKGDFINLPALEAPIYQNLNKGSYYFTPKDGTKENLLDKEGNPFVQNNFTALRTESTTWSSIKALKEDKDVEKELLDSDSIFLGTFESTDTKYYVHYTTDHQPYFAISPNDDLNRDYVAFQGTFLRNVKNLSAKVFNEKGEKVWESNEKGHNRKNFDNDLNTIVGVLRPEYLTWNGKNHEGKVVPDGKYTYRISYTPVTVGAKEQFLDFNIDIYTKAPELPKSATFNEDSRIVTIVSPGKPHYPIYRERIAYTYMDVDGEITEYIEKEDDGTFKLLEEAEGSEDMIPLKLTDFTYVIEDMAGNISYVSLTDLLKQSSHHDSDNNITQQSDNKNHVEIEKLPDSNTQSDKIVDSIKDEPLSHPDVLTDKIPLEENLPDSDTQSDETVDPIKDETLSNSDTLTNETTNKKEESSDITESTDDDTEQIFSRIPEIRELEYLNLKYDASKIKQELGRLLEEKRDTRVASNIMQNRSNHGPRMRSVSRHKIGNASVVKRLPHTGEHHHKLATVFGMMLSALAALLTFSRKWRR